MNIQVLLVQLMVPSYPWFSFCLYFLSVFSLVIISLWKFFQVFLILKSWYYVFLSHLFLPQDWMVISQKNVHILIHGTRLHEFVWKRGLCSFKLRILRWDHPGLFRWAQIQWWVSLEEPEKGWDRHGGESDLETIQGSWELLETEAAQDIFPMRPQREGSPGDTLIPDSCPFCWPGHCPCLSHLVCGSLSHQWLSPWYLRQDLAGSLTFPYSIIDDL